MNEMKNDGQNSKNKTERIFFYFKAKIIDKSHTEENIIKIFIPSQKLNYNSLNYIALYLKEILEIHAYG